jgi:hypothetical protein
MQTWAKRGLQTALVTGGLLMLGTGIASANENVNPDRPASPIDGGAGIGLHMDNNVVGTPLGQVQAPAVDRTVGTDGVTGAVPAPLPGANRGRADIVVPVDISGNAVAAGGDARTANESTQTVDQPDPVFAGWGPGSAADNVVAVNHAAPVQVTGNAVSLVGNATSVNDATQSATTGGDISTDGAGRTLAGNVIAEQGATPVQVDGNAVAAGGQARTYSTTASDARSNGSLGTSGDGGTASGNVGGVPLAVPVEVTHQAVSGIGIGNADAAGQNTVTAQGGDSNLSTPHGASYVRTDGDPSTLSGNVASPGAADPVALACNAISAVGNTNAQCATTNTNTAGGPVNTAGCGSTGSGNTALVPVAEPSEVFGNGAAAIGNANAGASNTDASNALGNSYNRGDGAALSSNGVTAPVAGANDVFANGVSAVGNAAGTAGNDVTSGSGGYTGTTGTASTGSGNIGQLPVAAPVEAYGLTGSAGGTATGTVPTETKSIRAGGSPNAHDDNGTASSNVVAAPTAVPAQVFGDAAGLVANTGAAADNASTVTAGGNPSATGADGTGSGNIVQLATATPAQLFDDGASVVGNGAVRGENDTTTGAGGKATSTGRGGTVAGDIVNVPDAGPIQAFGVAAASPGNEEADALNNTTTTAGADTATNGDHGALAGDVVTAQVTQVEQVLGSGLAGAGNSRANGVNNTAARSGGDVTTSGDWGALSGDLADVPATDLTQAVTDGVAALGNQRAFGDNRTSAVSGGAATTSGGGFLNGTGVVQPVGAAVTVFRVPVDVLGRAVDHGFNNVSVTDGGTDPQVDVPFGAARAQQQFGPADSVDGLLRADQVPALNNLSMGYLRRVPNLRGAVPGAPLSVLDQTQQFPAIGALSGPSALDVTRQVPAINALPGSSADVSRRLPAIGALSGPAALDVTRQLPAVGALSGPANLTRQLPAIGGPVSPAELTQRLPIIANGPMRPAVRPGIQPAARPGTQAMPVSSGYLPMTGELPVTGALPALPTPAVPAVPAVPVTSVPRLPAPGTVPVSTNVPTLTRPQVPSLSALPDLPPVPTLPAMPPLPGRPSTQDLPTSGLSTPSLPTSGLATPSLPTLANPSLPALQAPTLTGPSVPSVPTAPKVPTVPAVPKVPTVPTLPAPHVPTPPSTHALPVSTPLPAAPSLFTPTIPAVPTLPTPHVSAPALPSAATLPSAPSLPSAATLPSAGALSSVPALPGIGVPQTQDMPAGSAQQLMAQLKNLISDLENSASGNPTRFHPMQGLGDLQPPIL